MPPCLTYQIYLRQYEFGFLSLERKGLLHCPHYCSKKELSFSFGFIFHGSSSDWRIKPWRAINVSETGPVIEHKQLNSHHNIKWLGKGFLISNPSVLRQLVPIKENHPGPKYQSDIFYFTSICPVDLFVNSGKLWLLMTKKIILTDDCMVFISLRVPPHSWHLVPTHHFNVLPKLRTTPSISTE